MISTIFMQDFRGVDTVSMSEGLINERFAEVLRNGMDEYRLVVRPGQDICDLIYGEYINDKNRVEKPEILLGVFLAREAMEDTLIRWIQRICDRMTSFPVMLNNYGSFPPHTIYLRVQDHQPFRQLITQLNIIDEYLRSGGSTGVSWIARPHISIMANLKEEEYGKWVKAYAPRTFNASFQAQELVLEKNTDAGKNRKLVNRFHLLP